MIVPGNIGRNRLKTIGDDRLAGYYQQHQGWRDACHRVSTMIALAGLYLRRLNPSGCNLFEDVDVSFFFFLQAQGEISRCTLHSAQGSRWTSGMSDCCRTARRALLFVCHYAMLASSVQSIKVRATSSFDRGAVSLGSFGIPDYDINGILPTHCHTWPDSLSH